jgi:signal transduction histidine kinase
MSIVATFFILSGGFLEIYYIGKEKAEFLRMYEIIKLVSTADSEESNNILSEISANSTTTVIITDNSFSEIYSSGNIFGGRTLGRQNNIPAARDLLKILSGLIDIPEGREYIYKMVTDPVGTQRLFLAARLTPDYTLFLSKPIESIRNSIEIYNDFFIMTSLIVLVFGGIAVFVFGSKLVRPIYEMVDISKRIARLDFSKKYKTKGNDELNMLGECINTMSDKLSENILALSQANIDLQNDLSQKERNEEMRKEFLQNASHELKTPISVIASYSEMLKDKIITADEDRDYYYNVIYDETGKMSNIVRNLLGLAQLESQNRGLNIEKFDISELVCDILSGFSVIIEKNEITLEKDICENLSAIADKFLIERVISNYISNACDHIGENKKMRVTLRNIDNTVYFGVYNSTGEILDYDKVWASFYKGDGSRGNGLGLSIVKAIMESHKKEFGFKETDGGIEFYIRL